ncbi:MAG TPA: hypothetical protein VM142_13185 [Acidimicrobiales bacterium]|nr:hypothetical protein [Acidimicrobiales bacterium]
MAGGAEVIRCSVVALGLLAFLLPIAPSPAGADHTPLNTDGGRWRSDAANDFNLDLVWTQGYAAQGAAFQQRVRDVVARDPSCFANSCTPTSYARWYLHQAQPYFGGAESPVANFNPANPDPTIACGALGSVSFHWLTPSLPGRLGETYRCPYSTDPTRVFSSQVVVNPNPPAPGTLDTAAVNCAPGAYTWFTAGPADANNDAPQCRTYDLMSLLAHEVGHVLGFWEYRTDAAGSSSVDPVCLNGSESDDPRLGNNTNRETMCIPIFPGTERQRTPEEHEKDAFAKLYPPTGPAPTISPALQPTSPTTGSATWTVGVPRDSTRATTLQMVYGDGTYDIRAVPQGSGSATFTISHPFNAQGTYTQGATVVETGGSATSRTVRALLGPRNMVGYMKLKGNNSANIVTVTGLGTWNGENPDTGAHTVSSAVASSTQTGTFDVYTSGINTTDKYLRAGTYDINVQDGNGSSTYGYTNHTTWNNPGGDCMTWTIDGNTKKVGTAVLNAGTDGVIDSVVGGNPVAGSPGWFRFNLPTAPNQMNASPGSYEQAVCISHTTSPNGIMAPLDIV